MTFPRRRFLRLLTAAAAAPALPRIANAQAAYPTRIVKLVVGFPPGGGADAVSRIIANRLSELWGQQVVVENKPGAGSNLALDTVANSTPDGYTIIMSVRAPGLSRFLFSSLSYDPDSFAPVSRIGTYTHLLVVPKDHPAKSMGEFIANAKANPGKVTFASPGVGTPSHLTAELLKTRAGFDMTHVPYRGVAAGAMSDLVAGRIDAMINTTGSLLQASRGGQVRGLAVTAGKRSALAPEFPTMQEFGRRGLRHFVVVRAVHARQEPAGASSPRSTPTWPPSWPSRRSRRGSRRSASRPRARRRRSWPPTPKPRPSFGAR